MLTTNYDPFLEAASTSKYREALLKPFAAYGSDAGTMNQIPVFHIHGYVPHPHQATKKIETKPFLKDLVMDRSSYEKAWRRTDVFGPTMLHQIHYLRSYSVLFIGFSFSDKLVRGLLKDIHNELKSHMRNHFAFLSESDFDEQVGRDRGFYDEMGIVPITYSTPKEIPDLLGKLYRAGLEADHKGESIPIAWVTSRSHRWSSRKPSTTSATGYWDALLGSRLCHARMSELTAGEE